jgi:hypothetical protein
LLVLLVVDEVRRDVGIIPMLAVLIHDPVDDCGVVVAVADSLALNETDVVLKIVIANANLTEVVVDGVDGVADLRDRYPGLVRRSVPDRFEKLTGNIQGALSGGEIESAVLDSPSCHICQLVKAEVSRLGRRSC